jgi:hypothetical protein
MHAFVEVCDVCVCEDVCVKMFVCALCACFVCVLLCIRLLSQFVKHAMRTHVMMVYRTT